MNPEPHVFVCVGGGGVGKTTTSTAMAMAFARAGYRTLIVTVDPARRLADALGVELGPDVQAIALEESDDVLLALMPDPESGMRTFAGILFENELEALARVLKNRVYHALEDTVPGIQELVTMHLVSRAITEHDVEVVVVDTAPSRFALDFVSHPARMAELVDGRTITWLARMARRGGARKEGRAERLIGKVMGPSITSVADLFADIALVRRHFVELNRRASELLLGANSRYLVVAAPTGGSLDDACYLHDQLVSLKIHTAGLIINRSARAETPWVDVLTGAPELPSTIREALHHLESEQQSRVLAAELVAAEVSRRYPTLSQIRLPFYEAMQPDELVRCLAEKLHPQLEKLLGTWRPPALTSVPPPPLP